MCRQPQEYMAGGWIRWTGGCGITPQGLNE